VKLIVSGIFSVIGLLLIFIINLTKGKGVVGVLVAPIVAAPIIFGVVFGVLMLLSKILKIDSILAEKSETETNDSVSVSSSTTSVGKNVNFTISDDMDSTEKIETLSVSDDMSEDSENDKLPEINSDKNLDFPDLDDGEDSSDSSESEEQATADDVDSYENFSMKKITPGLPPEEIIKDKIGVAATPEEIAKGIKTILKRQGGLSGDD
jgi:hypothetical protein